MLLKISKVTLLFDLQPVPRKGYRVYFLLLNIQINYKNKEVKGGGRYGAV